MNGVALAGGLLPLNPSRHGKATPQVSRTAEDTDARERVLSTVLDLMAAKEALSTGFWAALAGLFGSHADEHALQMLLLKPKRT